VYDIVLETPRKLFPSEEHVHSLHGAIEQAKQALQADKSGLTMLKAENRALCLASLIRTSRGIRSLHKVKAQYLEHLASEVKAYIVHTLLWWLSWKSIAHNYAASNVCKRLFAMDRPADVCAFT
jgi:hypothetical protein